MRTFFIIEHLRDNFGVKVIADGKRPRELPILKNTHGCVDDGDFSAKLYCYSLTKADLKRLYEEHGALIIDYLLKFLGAGK